MKRSVSVILSVLILAFSVMTAVSAENGRELSKIKDGVLNVVIDGGTQMHYAAPGSEVEVRVKLVNNNAISSLKADISWSDKLTLVNAEYDIRDGKDNSVFLHEPEDEDGNVDWSTVNGHFVFNWLSAMSSVKGDTTYLTMKFKVAEDAAPGEFLPVTATVSDVFVDLDTDIEFNLVNGGVDVVEDGSVPDTAETTEGVPGNEKNKGWIYIIISAVVVAIVIPCTVLAAKKLGKKGVKISK